MFSVHRLFTLIFKVLLNMEDTVVDSYSCNLSLTVGNGDSSPLFSIADHKWKFSLFHSYDDFIGFSLVHLSKEPVQASYSVKIKNKNSSNDFIWIDPDDKVSFSGLEHPDSSWGTEELIDYTTLADVQSGFYVNKSINVSITMKVYGISNNVKYRNDNNTMYDRELLDIITKEDSSIHELRNYVDNDITNIIRKVGGNNITQNGSNQYIKNVDTTNKQDLLVNTRLISQKYR